MSPHQAVVSHQALNGDLFAFQGEIGHRVMGIFFNGSNPFERVHPVLKISSLAELRTEP